MVLVAIAVFAISIFFISGQIGFFSAKYTLKAYFSDAGGLREGNQVQVAGIPAGSVQHIRISPYSESSRAVEVDMRIPQQFQSQIRADSEASLETSGLLGEKHVNISRGSAAQPSLKNGDVLKSREEADIKKIVQNTNDVIANLRVLSAKLNDVSTQIQSSRGSLGKLIYDQAFYNRLNETAAGVQRLMAKVENGQGTVGKLLSDETLYQRANATIERINQMIEDVQHGKGTLPKLLSDPTLYDNLNRAVERANTLVGNVNDGHGTLGKLATDPQLYNRMNDALDSVDRIAERMQNGEGTLGKLSTDATLYKNLSESSQSLREFLTEFRKSPKKYLTLRVRIF
jgi:phospholipid/cholesterol/gamma-HCH transport system substrate-binding protein